MLFNETYDVIVVGAGHAGCEAAAAAASQPAWPAPTTITSYVSLNNIYIYL